MLDAAILDGHRDSGRAVIATLRDDRQELRDGGFKLGHSILLSNSFIDGCAASEPRFARFARDRRASDGRPSSVLKKCSSDAPRRKRYSINCECTAIGVTECRRYTSSTAS